MIVWKHMPLIEGQPPRYAITGLSAGDLRLIQSICEKAQVQFNGDQANMVGRLSRILFDTAEGKYPDKQEFTSNTSFAEDMFLPVVQ
jgi:hypothetical protein